MEWAVIDANGSSGRILIDWYSQKSSKISMTCETYTLSTILREIKDDQVIAVTNVYWLNYAADNNYYGMSYRILETFRVNFDGSWVIASEGSLLLGLLVKGKVKELILKIWRDLVILLEVWILFHPSLVVYD